MRNKLTAIQGKTEIQKITNDYNIARWKNTIEWKKLSQEQQKILLQAGSKAIDVLNMTGGPTGTYSKTTGPKGTSETWTEKY